MKKDNIPGLEGYYISRLGILWSRYHKSGKLTQNEWHKDNVVTHNRYRNLYWGTQAENMQQCINDGRTLKGNKNPMYGISRRGAANPNAKLTKTQRKEILYRSKRGESIGELANLFGVSKVTVRRVLNPNLRSFNRIR